MRIVIVYESMYGNTHLVATSIAEGIGSCGDVTVVSVRGALPEVLEGADLLIVGGPTHVHSMSTKTSRKGAFDAAQKPDADVSLDPDAAGGGLREWFATLDTPPTNAAAFDTRVDRPSLVTGRASKGIARQLRRHGYQVVADPTSFFVTKHNVLEPDEIDRARRWGAALAATNLNVGGYR